MGQGLPIRKESLMLLLLRRKNGMGVGLAVSRFHRRGLTAGPLWAENNPSGGATFSVALTTFVRAIEFQFELQAGRWILTSAELSVAPIPLTYKPQLSVNSTQVYCRFLRFPSCRVLRRFDFRPSEVRGLSANRKLVTNGMREIQSECPQSIRKRF